MRAALTGGAYQARSVVASAQRSLNLYAEMMPQIHGEPSPFAYYPAAGLSQPLVTLPTAPVRGLYRATNNQLYAVGGSTVYSVSSAFQATALGTITAGLTRPVSMSDNGTTLVIVDGTPGGWKVTLAGGAFAPISDATSDPDGVFEGADRTDYLDGFLLFNKPNTPQFQSSNAEEVVFDPLYFADKISHSDLLMSIAVAKREIWLIGTTTTEIWVNSGAQDFPFQSFPNVIIDSGTVAKYSVATVDNTVFWLSQSRQGEGIVMQGAGYQNTRVSTYAIEYELSTYPRLDDAVAMTYQYAGHTFYHLTFPSANANMGKSWLYDLTTQQWSELAWIDANGTEWRHRANCAAFCYDQVVVGDWQNGNLYRLNPNVYTDFGGPIRRVRCWPHLINDGNRVFYQRFRADLEAGTATSDLV